MVILETVLCKINTIWIRNDIAKWEKYYIAAYKMVDGKKKALSHVAKLRYNTDNSKDAIVSKKIKVTVK